jgi:hypothetical protein
LRNTEQLINKTSQFYTFGFISAKQHFLSAHPLYFAAYLFIMENKKTFGFNISEQPYFDSRYNIDERAKKLLEETFFLVTKKKKGLEEKLIKYVEEYPEIPHFKNRLTSYYQLTGKLEKVKEVNDITLQFHPEYLFGKINTALEYYYEKEFSKIPLILGEKLELDALYPERKVFQIAEVIGYYKVVALYLNAVRKTMEAWDIIDKLENIVPGNAEVQQVTKKIMLYNMERMGEWMKEDQKTRITIDGKFKQTIPATEEMPVFKNAIIKELYAYNFRLPAEILKSILALPEESLMADLKKVLDDSIARYHYFSEDINLADEETMFLVHAIFIIAEKKRVDLLPHIFEVLKHGNDFTEFYFGDLITELLWIALYRLCMDNPAPLFDFLKERDTDTFSKTATIQALEQIYYHNRQLQETIIKGYKELTAYFITYKNDIDLLDTVVIAGVACAMRDTAPDKLDNEIKQLYEHNLVALGYAGDYESLTANERKEDWKVKAVPGIFEMYEEVITTWGGYTEDEDEEDDDWDDEIKDDLDNEPFDDEHSSYGKGFHFPEPQQPFVRAEVKIGRNDPCPCGSGKKYKKCCMGSVDN